MVVDSSAVIAIAFGEANANEFDDTLLRSDGNVCSPVTFAECAMILIGKRAATPLADVVALFKTLKIEQAQMDRGQGLLAAEAFQRFGKGRRPAKLNLGDCFSYALAKSLQPPLLYKGEDFAKTDIVSALAVEAKP